MKKQVRVSAMGARYFRAESALSEELYAKAREFEGRAEARMREALAVLGDESGTLIPVAALYRFGADGAMVFEWDEPDPPTASAPAPSPCGCRGAEATPTTEPAP